jgi:glycosyltransferase involved in cell wall biosynthesis
MANRHLLYVAWGYPPCRGSGVYRALATPNHFARAGWRVTVLTADARSFERYTGADTSLLDLVDPAIEVVRVPFDRPDLDGDLSRWPRLRVEAPDVWLRLHRWRERAMFPEAGYGSWRRPLERAALDVHRRTPVDLTIATANPHVDFTAAAALAKLGVPYVMDYRDAWQLDVFTGDRLSRPAGAVHRWESRLVAHAHEVWFVNDPILRWHAEMYPDQAHRMHVVPNGYDGGIQPRSAPRASDAPVFGFLGTISPKVPVAEFEAGWLRASSDGRLGEARALIAGYQGFWGGGQASGEVLPSGVERVGPVPKTEVASFYDQCDALLLILGTGRYVTSGKVYEYIATGLPIVSVHDPGNAATDVLRDYPLWFPSEGLAPDQVAAALARAAEEVRRPDAARWREAAAWAPRVARATQLAPRIAALTEAVDR